MAEVRKGASRRGRTRISAKNQVTLPVAAMRAAGLAPGDELRVEPDGGGRLVLIREHDPLEDLVGDMGDVYTPGFLDRLRDEWR